MAIKQLRLKIEGIVQGVCYRAYTSDQAHRLGLTGWVCNLPDGSVELCAEGPEESLNELAAWCEHGPPSAQVFRVERKWSDAQGEFSRFSIVRK